MQTTESVPSVERAFAMMEALDRSSNGVSVADLSRRLNIPRSSAHAIALTLERCGYLTRDESQRKCRLSTKAYMLGREAIRPEQIALAALPPMRRLSAQTMLTSHLAILEENQATYIQKVQVPGPLHVDTFIGKRTNLHCTAVGKVLLSFAPESCRANLFARGSYARYTPKTITSATGLREELKRISVNGYAFDDQEEELEIRCVAVPVFSDRGEFLAALSLSGAMNQINERALPEAVIRLRQTAKLVSDQVRSGWLHA
jgi:DNA-binding IclR family transcriptional regulator